MLVEVYQVSVKEILGRLVGELAKPLGVFLEDTRTRSTRRVGNLPLVATGLWSFSRGGTHKIEVSDIIIFMHSIQPSMY